MDELTDDARLVVLMVFVHCVYLKRNREDLLLCRPLPKNTLRCELFNLLDEYFTLNEIQSKNCADVCTDGKTVMMDYNTEAIVEMKDKIVLKMKCSSGHCDLHKYRSLS